jgi:hypothetical protein
LAKPNYRHQKKQKEQARKVRQAEKIKRRLERDAEAAPEGSKDTASPAAPVPAASAVESKP